RNSDVKAGASSGDATDRMACGRGEGVMMSCGETRVLMHALLDGELDAGHARDVESHLAGCAKCATEFAGFRDMRQAMRRPDLRLVAPEDLRRRIEAAIPVAPRRPAVAPTRRSLLQGFALGTAMSAVAATGVVTVVLRADRDERVLGDVVSAHLRSLQAEHLTDVLSTDQHTVKPWFNGKLDVAPPVADLTAQGFTLLGGRLDYIDGKAVAAIVYRRRVHVINLFVSQAGSMERAAARSEMLQGFNIR